MAISEGDVMAEQTFTIKQAAEQTGISEDTLQQLVDFMDIKLKQGRPRQEYLDQSQHEVLKEHEESTMRRR